MQINTPEEAEDYIKSKGFEIQLGQAYSIFSCGCVVYKERAFYIWKRFPKGEKNEFEKKGINTRCCREHKTAGLYLGSFKKCSCGSMLFSKKNVRSGGTCPVCNAHFRALKAIRNRKPSRRNLNKRDLSRTDCKSRGACLVKYDGYDTLPCKGCLDYIKGGIEADIALQGCWGLNKYDETEYEEASHLDSLSL